MDKEDFEVLNCVFHHTIIPSMISEQQNERTLHVFNIDTFTVEWHMSGELKNLKCMDNISKGAASKSPCLYFYILKAVLYFIFARPLVKTLKRCIRRLLDCKKECMMRITE